MKQQTRLKIGIVLLLIAVLVSMFMVGYSAFLAGGRKACYSIDMYLMEGFVCEEVEQQTIIEGDLNYSIFN